MYAFTLSSWGIFIKFWIALPLDALEPSPEQNKGYEDFWKEKYRETSEKKEKQGNEEDWAIAVGYKKILDQEKELSDKKQLYKNNLLYTMKDCEELTFGENGRVVRSKFKMPVLYLHIKRMQQILSLQFKQKQPVGSAHS